MTQKPLFLAVLSAVNVQIKGTDRSYWAYIPKPPINLAVSWGDMDIPVVVNVSSWLPGPYDN